jgi:hypothetical protein
MTSKNVAEHSQNRDADLNKNEFSKMKASISKAAKKGTRYKGKYEMEKDASQF